MRLSQSQFGAAVDDLAQPFFAPGLGSARPVPVTIAIDNYRQILQAYGAEIADLVTFHVRAKIYEWLGLNLEIEAEQDGVFFGRYCSDIQGNDVPRGRFGNRSIETALRNLPLISLDTARGIICLSLSGACQMVDVERRAGAGAVASNRKRFFGAAAGEDDGWAQRYRTDMASAAAVLEAIGRAGIILTMDPAARQPVEHIVLGWQPVRDPQDVASILYYDVLPHLLGADGQRRDLDDTRVVLERLGLAFALDCYLVDQAIDLLEADPDLALGIRVSAQSVCDAARWAGTFRRLTGDRGVATRLAIKITETASFPDMAGAIEFVARLKALGVVVAIDNFGMGYTSIRELLALSPDIVCIDPFFVTLATGQVSSAAALGHLAGLARALASIVVVQGVANEDHCRLAHEAGVRWQRGDFLGASGAIRAWASSPRRNPCRLPQVLARRVVRSVMV